MTALTYTLQADGDNGSFAAEMSSGRTALCAHGRPFRDDGKFSGVSLNLQASAIHGTSPDAADAELFYQTVALLRAAPKLLSALEDMLSVFEGEYGAADLNCIRAAKEAIAEATTHPLQEQMEADEIAYEESQEMARARAAERSDRDDLDDHDNDNPYLYGDEDTGEDCNVEADADHYDLQRDMELADHERKAASEERLLGGAA